MAGGGHIWYGNYVIRGRVVGKHLGDFSCPVQLPVNKNIERNPLNTILQTGLYARYRTILGMRRTDPAELETFCPIRLYYHHGSERAGGMTLAARRYLKLEPTLNLDLSPFILTSCYYDFSPTGRLGNWILTDLCYIISVHWAQFYATV